MHRRGDLARRARRELAVGGEHAQRFGCAAEHARDVLAGPEQVRKSRGDLTLVAQQPQVPRGRSERVGHAPVREQPGVRIGRVGEVGQQHRQQRALQRRAPRQSGRQRVEVLQRARRIGETERRQPPAGLLGRQPQIGRRHPGHRIEQRPVEQLLVQAAHLARVQRPLGVPDRARIAALVGTKAHRERQPRQLRRIVGDEMGSPQAAQLQPVLGRAQERVRVRQAQRVVATDVSAVAQRIQRRQRAADAQRVVAATVHELQQLHGELDVAQARPAELELAVGNRRRDVRDHAPPHRLHVGDEVRTFGGRPHERADRRPRTARRVRGRRRPAAPSAAPGTPRCSPTAGSTPRSWRACAPAAPSLPSGRSAASTSHATSRHSRMVLAASVVAVRSARSVSAGSPSKRPGSATNTTSTSET